MQLGVIPMNPRIPMGDGWVLLLRIWGGCCGWLVFDDIGMEFLRAVRAIREKGRLGVRLGVRNRPLEVRWETSMSWTQ